MRRERNNNNERRPAERSPYPKDRLPPHSAEAEMGVLGCCLINPQKRIAECQARFGAAGREVFYDQRHGEVYEAMTSLADRMSPVDVLTVYEELKRRGTIEQVGGAGFISVLPDATPSELHLPAYVAVVWAAYLRRRMYKALATAAEVVMSYSGPAEQVGTMLDGVEAKVLEVQRQAGQGEQEARPLKTVVGEALVRIDEIRRGVGLILGIRTHYGHLDKFTGGLHRKQVTILAARPGTGKTALAMGMAQNIAEREKIGVGVFSMEMDDLDLAIRMLCKDAEVDSHKLRTGFASHEDLERMPEVGLRLSKLPIWIDGTPALGILELRARARRLVSEHKVEVIVVDYVQLMHGSRDYRDNRALELAEISGGLLALSKELNVALLVLSQLNRETEKQKNRKPQLADIRESGAIEQDASTVMMLYRPKTKKGEEEEEGEDGELPEVVKVNALIAKQRHGPQPWDVEFLFNRKYTRFEDAYQNKGHLLTAVGSVGAGGASEREKRDAEAEANGMRGGAIPEDL